MNKTNIKDLININNKKFIASIDDFKYEFNKGLCFTFNGRESFYGYYDCINEIVEYINNELSSYEIFSIKGCKLEKAKVIIEGYDICIEISGLKYYVGLIVKDKNIISTFDKFSINKNAYKDGSNIIYELFFSWVVGGNEESVAVGSFICNNYDEYLSHSHWGRIKSFKKEEAEYKCQLCSSNEKLNVHHNNYDNLFMEESNDLIVLCESCHKKFHGIG